jgi:hypothetical protein
VLVQPRSKIDKVINNRKERHNALDRQDFATRGRLDSDESEPGVTVMEYKAGASIAILLWLALVDVHNVVAVVEIGMNT